MFEMFRDIFVFKMFRDFYGFKELFEHKKLLFCGLQKLANFCDVFWYSGKT